MYTNFISSKIIILLLLLNGFLIDFGSGGGGRITFRLPPLKYVTACSTHARRPIQCDLMQTFSQIYVQKLGGTEIAGDRAGDAGVGQQVHVRGAGGRVHRVPDAQPDGGHGAGRVPRGQAVRRPDAGPPRAAVLATGGSRHRAPAPRPDTGEDGRGGRGRRARRGVRPDGQALRHAVGVLRRVHRQERGPGDDRRVRRRTGHGRAPGTVAPRRTGRV